MRGGGHSYPGLSVCDGGIVIDLGPMKGIRVNPEARTARVQAGVLWGELDRETQAFGLATTGGIVSHTGVAGLTLGGGLGWLHRKHGLTIDQLLSVDLITAGGEFVTASRTENPELFWGLRGGGGNFGIATEFEFRLHPVGPTVLAGPIFWPIEQAPELLRFYREWSAEAPDELMTIVVQRRAPAASLRATGAPRRARRRRRVLLCRAGRGRGAGRAAAQGVRAAGARPLRAEALRRAPGDVRRSFPHGWRYYFRACDVAGLSDDVIDVMVEHGRRIVSPITSVAFFQMGGAVARVGESETAFNGREAAFSFNINGNSRPRKDSRPSASGHAPSGPRCSPTTPAST